MKLGFIGLGKMGRRMVGKLLSEKHEIVAMDKSPGAIEDLLAERKQLAINGGDSGLLSVAESLPDLVEKLTRPRIIWMMLPAGGPTDAVLGTLSDLVDLKDILIDGGNSNYKDTERRFAALGERKVKYLGIGVSGGIIAEKQGYPLMVGGDKSAYKYIEPILTSLAKPFGGYNYLGTGGRRRMSGSKSHLLQNLWLLFATRSAAMKYKVNNLDFLASSTIKTQG